MNSKVKSSQPLVSIIIYCYNHQNSITQCLKSVLRQTYRNVELIVIDDGSSDKSADILERLSQKYHFSFERQEKMGLSKTLDKAVAKAKGKYIAPLGCADILMLDKTEKQVQYLEKHAGIAAVGGNILCINGKGIIQQNQQINVSHEADFATVFLEPKKIPPPPTIMIRTVILQEVNGFSIKSNFEYLDLWLKVTHAGHRIAVLNDIYAYYRKHKIDSDKNDQFMTEGLMRIYSKYKREPDYLYVKNTALLRMFLKVSKKDRHYAWEIFKQISPKYYNLELFRGVFYMLLPTKDYILSKTFSRSK